MTYSRAPIYCGSLMHKTTVHAKLWCYCMIIVWKLLEPPAVLYFIPYFVHLI
ncbi:hypothetical protein XELAEV_18026927mg [Xenopus laevis]|uniref:Uncharacterized protein n=1 Tax=Xenopus laevis TaxID=8355 RepID=A0A974CWI4_XENLA|nr:hypothetical protein XELAEV_18026927mg [Xenopus laevis]